MKPTNPKSKKRNVIVYDCNCTWTRATTGKDTLKTISLPDMIKGTAETTCHDEETIIPRDTDVKDSVSCKLL